MCKRMTEKRVKSVRLPADVSESVEQLAEDRDVSESDMLRRLVERGLREDRLGEVAESVDRIEAEVSKPVWRRLW